MHLYVTNLLHGFATFAAEELIGSNTKHSHKIGLKTSLLDPYAQRSTAQSGILTRWPVCKCNPQYDLPLRLIFFSIYNRFHVIVTRPVLSRSQGLS